jgi:hypothetical protein
MPSKQAEFYGLDQDFLKESLIKSNYFKLVKTFPPAILTVYLSSMDKQFTYSYNLPIKYFT